MADSRVNSVATEDPDLIAEPRTAPASSRQLPVFPLAPDPVRPGADARIPLLRDLEFSPGEAQGPTVGLVTLGCDKNTVDSERILATLVARGAHVTDDIDQADVVVVNTCGFIQAAKEQSIETLLEAHAMRADGGGPRAVVAVGCLVERYKDDLQAEMPEIDLFLGLSELDRLVPELEARSLLDDAEPTPIMERPLRVLSTATAHTSFLKISEGCDHTCAFCAIPLMRGLHRSQPLPELVAEARALGQQGVRELNVISQDTTWYGRDLRRKQGAEAPLLPDLLDALIAETEVDWFRLFYMYPSGITPAVVERIAHHDRIVPYLDLPLQHGSDRILERMRRPERQATILDRVARLRAAVPDITLRTTVIVGFPGETDEDFADLLELLEHIQFDRVGAFTYSTEEGTRAATMDGQVPDSLMRERLEHVLDVQSAISLERNQRWIGRTVPVLIDEAVHDDPEFAWIGHAINQAVDVDGVTYIRPDGEDGREATPWSVGDLVELEVVDATEHDLIARRQANNEQDKGV